MPIPSPFHTRTAPLCTSYRWKEWAGYYAVCSYDTCHEREYYALREASGMLDVTPLYKYEVYGPDAARVLSRMMVRDVTKLRVGRVAYTCWCDDDGKVVDDGTVSRLEKQHYRVTAADPSFGWICSLARGFDVTVEDSSRRLAALAVQGPTSRAVLASCSDADLDRLRFFRITRARVGDLDVWISRTGYTGDLGYEVWVESAGAERLWDAVLEAGKPHGLEPVGLDALDMTRIEAGFIMLHVDYYSATKQTIESRKSSPYEINLGWMVRLEREPFLGQEALRREHADGSTWRLVGLEADWGEIEALYERYDLPPALPAAASRDPLPVYSAGGQIGQATSHAWSPILKKSLALASLESGWAKPGREVQIEHTVEFERHTVTARVRELPFFDPPRKKEIL